VRVLAFLVAATFIAPGALEAATLKPFAKLAGPVVRLSDLWDGVKSDTDLGPAPEPGGRITIPSAQLAAIARQFGVDWHPNSGGDRVILERLGRPLTRDDISPAIRTALTAIGASLDADVELGAFTAPLFPQEAKLAVTVAQVDLDKLSGRFSAQLDIAAADTPNVPLRITGRIQEMIDVPVARHRMLPGDVVATVDLEWAHLPKGLGHGDIVRTLADAIGLSAKQSIAPNQPIPLANLGRPVLVQKGNDMSLTLESPGISLSSRGIATEPGGLGEHIRVLNEYAHTTVEAVITGPGQARVVPGTARPANRYLAVR